MALAPVAARAQTPQIVPATTSAPDTSHAGAPLRAGDAVLFRLRAPADAAQVFVAGSFNNWADNQNGAVTDAKFALTDAGDGHFTGYALVEPQVESYKFVVLDKAGNFTWIADPNVAKTDEQGNSEVDFSKIERLAPAANREGAPIRQGDAVLFRFRAPAGAAKVFVAGSFNDFAQANAGVITGDKYAMTPGANGLYTRRESIGAATEKYKYVVLGADGQFTWMSDPFVKATDDDGNSVVDFSKIDAVN